MQKLVGNCASALRAVACRAVYEGSLSSPAGVHSKVVDLFQFVQVWPCAEPCLSADAEIVAVFGEWMVITKVVIVSLC